MPKGDFARLAGEILANPDADPDVVDDLVAGAVIAWSLELLDLLERIAVALEPTTTSSPATAIGP